MNIAGTIVAIFAGLTTWLGLAYYSHVHSERWSVKTLADNFELQTVPIATTIHEQVALPMPIVVGEEIGRLRSEKNLYTLQGLLVDAQMDVDQDYHLVVEDPETHDHMIVEIPDYRDITNSKIRNAFFRSRQAIDKLIGSPRAERIAPDPPPLIEVTGVGFFDEPHTFPPFGTAKNCREIHPVINVRVR